MFCVWPQRDSNPWRCKRHALPIEPHRTLFLLGCCVYLSFSFALHEPHLLISILGFPQSAIYPWMTVSYTHMRTHTTHTHKNTHAAHTHTHTITYTFTHMHTHTDFPPQEDVSETIMFSTRRLLNHEQCSLPCNHTSTSHWPATGTELRSVKLRLGPTDCSGFFTGMKWLFPLAVVTSGHSTRFKASHWRNKLRSWALDSLDTEYGCCLPCCKTMVNYIQI